MVEYGSLASRSPEDGDELKIQTGTNVLEKAGGLSRRISEILTVW